LRWFRCWSCRLSAVSFYNERVILRLPFGTGVVVADLRGLRCRVLQTSAPKGAGDPSALIGAALDAPVGCAPLAELARGRRRVVVLVPDATRKAHLSMVLPALLDRLRNAGVTAGDVTVLVACGTHPPAPEDALAALLGPLPGGVRVLQHDSRDDGALVRVGALASGEPVRLHRSAVEADLLLAVSALAHHYFAGFTGGPKMVFPGVAGHAEIQANHRLVIDLGHEPPRRHPGCEPGVLAGNPVAEEIALAAALRPPDLALLIVQGSDGRPAWCAAGPLSAVFPAGVERVREWYEVDAGSFTRIVAAAGGAPADVTIIQSHKALDAACRFAAPGAEVLFVASCEGGPGSAAMVPFLADPRPAAILDRLAREYVQYGHTTLRLVEKTARFRVLWHSRLEAGLVSLLGAEPAADVQQVLDRWREEAPGDTVGVVPGVPVYPHGGR
jgi:nickel-dependent lactate racemase